jgi:heme-degrading monooxygenase HmoA
MFTHLAIHYPLHQHRGAVLASMHRVAAAAQGLDGLVQVGPWTEEGGNRLVGMSLWTSREAFELGRALMFAAVADDPFDEWESRPPENLHLDEA